MAETLHLTGRLSPRESWSAEGCPVAASLEVLTTRSTFLILREAFYGTARFDDFAERVGISEPVAAQRLRDLVEQGLLAREDYREPGQRTRQQYVLTPMGEDLFPVLAALTQWGDRWLADGGAPVELRHHGCGEAVGVSVRCAAGHEASPGELDLVPRRRGRQVGRGVGRT